MTKPDWTLIANSTRARLLQQEPGAPMVILESFIHPASHARPREAAADQAAPSGRTGNPAASLGLPRPELTEFARELGHLLEQEAQLDHYRTLAIFASSPFLGQIVDQLGKCTQGRLSGVHEMDLTACTLGEIEERIAHETAADR